MLLNRRKLLNDRKLLGRWGEKRGEKFLKRKGLKLLARNFSCRAGEIDLIMVDQDGTVVFVEVRTKAQGSLAEPEDSITLRKRTRMVKTAKHFLAVNKIDNRPFRFDFIAIVLGQEGPEQIRHYQSAFVP